MYCWLPFLDADNDLKGHGDDCCDSDDGDMTTMMTPVMVMQMIMSLLLYLACSVNFRLEPGVHVGLLRFSQAVRISARMSLCSLEKASRARRVADLAFWDA